MDERIIEGMSLETLETLTLDQIKLLAEMAGYRFEIGADGIERMFCPDGTLALVARKTKEKCE